MAFSQRVEDLRPIAEAFVADAPADFLLDWIQKESNGNRCNFTTSAGFPEVGLFQLDPGNMAMAGTDQATLRSGCDGQVDNGTADDLITAMSTGVDYVNALKALAHQKLDSVGVDWDESTADFWSLVRFEHANGLAAADGLLARAANNLGRGPTGWDELIANGGRNHWTDVAAENGAWAAGYNPPSKIGAIFMTVLGLGLGALAGRWAAKRYLHSV
jgi:hypothetical protein